MTLPVLNFVLEEISECESTSNELLRRREIVSIHGLALRAERQLSGIGRRGRTWHTGNGNLALSFGLENIAPNILPFLPLSLALAVYRVCVELLPESSELLIKWPNDIYLDKKKLAGILMQVKQQGEHISAVLGLGLNIQSAPDLECSEYPAIALADYKVEVTPAQFARKILTVWKEYSQQSIAEISMEWEKAAKLETTEFQIKGEQGVWRGLRLGEGGELIVSRESEIRTLVSEEVSLRVL